MLPPTPEATWQCHIRAHTEPPARVAPPNLPRAFSGVPEYTLDSHGGRGDPVPAEAQIENGTIEVSSVPVAAVHPGRPSPSLYARCQPTW